MIKAECDRCGTQKETDGLTLAIPMLARPGLPEGWRRVVIPAADEAVQGERKELCERCVNALRQFFEGDGAVPGLLEPESLERVTVHLEETGEPGAEYRVTAIDGCTCPQPEEPRPPCSLHERPNLTARAEKIATGGNGVRSERCTCSGVGFGTEDCVPHHPDGLEKGTHLKCFQDAGEGECPGIYRRGMFAEHMSRWHRVPVAEKSKPCPYCATIASGIMELGPHIAAEHPGDWQAWIDGGQKAG
ncbi:hypothetical protein SEA_BOGOTA_63 [Streptomyces phage Bogota]|nr:hypothetical protein SEA_BOGOTA_63 [Streptomyces phage Bogota]